MRVWKPESTPAFSPSEMACKCGKCKGDAPMDGDLMEKLQDLRDLVERPLTITSGYRCAKHPEEQRKEKPGSHSAGLAADVKVANGKERYEILMAAMHLGFVGIGVANSFIHLDVGHPQMSLRPSVWKY